MQWLRHTGKPGGAFEAANSGNTDSMSGEGRPRVLVVDDNPRARTLVRLGLELEGLEVVEAGSVAEGRKLLDSRFDGYVFDRQLPDGDGLSLVPAVADGAPVII